MNLFRLVTVGAALMVIGGALPSVAGATDYCVTPELSCGLHNEATLEDAIAAAAAAPDSDRILLGAYNYISQSPAGFKYNASTAPVEIIGAGRGQTILTAPSGATDEVLRLDAGAGSSVHDLTIQIPRQVGGGGFRGLITKNTARRIEVVEDPDQANYRYGVLLAEGGVLEDSSVTLTSAPSSIGVWCMGSQLGKGVDAVRRSTVSADIGVASDNGSAIEHSRVTAGTTGVRATGGLTTMSGSVIRFTKQLGTGIVARSTTYGTTLKADGVTVVGPNQPLTLGVYATTFPNQDDSAHIDLTNSIVRADTPLATYTTGSGAGSITARYSDYDSGRNSVDGAHALISEGHIWNVGYAAFADPTVGDYHLRAGSPLVDGGDPDSGPGVDLEGNPLIADGNGDGTPRRDVGAFEFQPAPPGTGGPPPDGGPAADAQAPLISGFRSTRSVFAVAPGATPRAAGVARGTRLSYTLSENARVVLKIQRKLGTRYRTVGSLRRSGVGGPNRIRFTGRIGRRPLRPGRYRVVLTATDAAGNRSAPKAARFRIVR